MCYTEEVGKVHGLGRWREPFYLALVHRAGYASHSAHRTLLRDRLSSHQVAQRCDGGVPGRDW